MILLWIGILIAALVIEAATTALVSVWFAAAAIPALIAAACGASVTVQLIIYAVVFAVCLIFTRPALKKLMPDRYTPTNSELNVGKTAVVIEEINNTAGNGRVRLDGVDWSAVSSDGSIIPKESIVSVKEVISAKLYVELYGKE